MNRVLIACAHGTRAPAAREAVTELVNEIQQALPGHEVRDAYVDVHGPSIAEVVAAVPDHAEAVVVPLLLAGGFHVYHDIAQAVAGARNISVTPALGPDERLCGIVVQRLQEAGVPADASVVLAVAGSSDPRSQSDTATAVQHLQRRWAGEVRLGCASGLEPTVPQAVESLRSLHPSRPVAIATFLLAPGVFHKRLGNAAADFVTEPLAPHRSLVDIVVQRFTQAGSSSLSLDTSSARAHL